MEKDNNDTGNRQHNRERIIFGSGDDGVLDIDAVEDNVESDLTPGEDDSKGKKTGE